jgi:hypothetical protein
MILVFAAAQKQRSAAQILVQKRCVDKVIKGEEICLQEGADEERTTRWPLHRFTVVLNSSPSRADDVLIWGGSHLLKW